MEAYEAAKKRGWVGVSDERLMEMPKQEPVIDKSAAIRIATALGWEPKRTWVGLNWDDLPEIYVGDTAFLHGAKWAEAKLKEKNS